ncbi:MAG: endopeptidase [Clostridiales bacterium 43-6]|nr:MAG: endopeptidase [Clostridiales bacterium 43-6]
MFRSDLALEQSESMDQLPGGVESENLTVGEAKITRIKVVTQEGAEKMGKPVGNYITIELPPFSTEGTMDEDKLSAVKNEISRLIPAEGLILIIGIGNVEITPDALGPKAAATVLATRHISPELAMASGLGNLRPVAVLSPGVLGQTGIETGEILKGLVDKVKPSGVIVIDALASRKLSRLGNTIQISDTGISPGAGVGNMRNEINSVTLGVPVIAIGVPTVVDASTMVSDITGGQNLNENDEMGKMMVTPREIDLLIEHAAVMISHSINCALHPHLSSDDLLALVS